MSIIGMLIFYDYNTKSCDYSKKKCIYLKSGDAIPVKFHLFREVQQREFAVVFFCCLVVFLCGLFFVFEISEKFVFAVNVYPCMPFLPAFTPAYTFLF